MHIQNYTKSHKITHLAGRRRAGEASDDGVGGGRGDVGDVGDSGWEGTGSVSVEGGLGWSRGRDERAAAARAVGKAGEWK
jgi:hypothetical protein